MTTHESRPFALAHVLSAIVVIVSAPIGGSMWGFAYGTLINDTMDPLMEVTCGMLLGGFISVVTLIVNVAAWRRRRCVRMAAANTGVFTLVVVPLVLLIVIGRFL